MRLTGHRDLLLFHDLEEGRLGLWGGAVNLIRQHDMREEGALLKTEYPVSLVVFHQDRGANKIRRHQVRGKLNSLKATTQ